MRVKIKSTFTVYANRIINVLNKMDMKYPKILNTSIISYPFGNFNIKFKNGDEKLCQILKRKSI